MDNDNKIVIASEGTPTEINLEKAMEKARSESFSNSVEGSTQVRGDSVVPDGFFSN
jgi:hypothetical protein